jgi:acetyltransferase-like isoleucine patch superfamily enzyme
VFLGQYVFIDEDHPDNVTIKDNSTIGLRTSIINHLYWGLRTSESVSDEVVIEKNVYVGAHCLILPGVHIGEGAVIMGGTVVKRNVPAFTLWGPPAAEALGRVTVPLTKDNPYEDFVRGLRPIRKRRQGGMVE